MKKKSAKKSVKKPAKKKTTKSTKKVARPTLASLGTALTKILIKSTSPETPPLFVAMGKDSFVFYADLIRAVKMDLTCEMLADSKLDSAECFAVSGKTVTLVFAKNLAKNDLENLKNIFLKDGALKVLAVSPYGLSLS